LKKSPELSVVVAQNCSASAGSVASETDGAGPAYGKAVPFPPIAAGGSL